MPTLVNSTSMPHLLAQFNDWVRLEWGKPTRPAPVDRSLPLPASILAVENDTLLGGLGFTRFARPGSERLGVWIDTLYVAPAFRKRGIASDLVRAAEAEARALALDELFVYTALPALYERLDWQRVDVHEAATILRRSLAKE